MVGVDRGAGEPAGQLPDSLGHGDAGGDAKPVDGETEAIQTDAFGYAVPEAADNRRRVLGRIEDQNLAGFEFVGRMIRVFVKQVGEVLNLLGIW